MIYSVWLWTPISALLAYTSDSYAGGLAIFGKWMRKTYPLGQIILPLPEGSFC